MRLDIDRLVLVARQAATPAEAPIGTAGDTIEVHCVGGPVREVDPVTRKVTTTIKQFVVSGDALMR